MAISDVQGPLINTDICFVLQMIALLPLTSTILCIAFAVILHFDEVTKTHCKVSDSQNMPKYFSARRQIILSFYT